MISQDTFSIIAVDGRNTNQETDEIFEELRRKGFSVEVQRGEPQEKTVIYASVENYDAAVLLGRFVEPIPEFNFEENLNGEVILVVGENFEAFPLLPKTVQEVDTKSRPFLPVSQELKSENEQTLNVNNMYNRVLPVRQGEVSPMKLVKEIDGQPPAGEKCD